MGTLIDKNTATQCTQILEYLHTGKGITQKESIGLIGSYRLASRIFDLSKKGYSITFVREQVLNRHGRKTSIKRYYLAEFQPENALPVVPKVSAAQKRFEAALFYLHENIHSLTDGKAVDQALKIASGLAKYDKKD